MSLSRLCRQISSCPRSGLLPLPEPNSDVNQCWVESPLLAGIEFMAWPAAHEGFWSKEGRSTRAVIDGRR